MPENYRPSVAEPSTKLAPADQQPHRTGPYSRALERGAVGGLNGNSREAKFIKAYAAMLTEHCGGHPSPVQAQLIIRASRLALHLELWDEQTIPNGGAFTATGHNHYIAWSNALARTLARLGLQPATAPQPSFQDILADIAARRRTEPEPEPEDADDQDDAA
jgi:hypothetical protein